MSQSHRCESCKFSYEKIFCCHLCARFVCHDCVGDIICDDVVEILNDGIVCNRPCYKCAAFNLVPILTNDQLKTLNPDFLAEMVLCYSNINQLYALKTHSEVLKYFDTVWSPSFQTLNYFHVRWRYLLILNTTDVRCVIELYKACGYPFLSVPPILPRYFPSSSLLHQEFSIRATGARRPLITDINQCTTQPISSFENVS